MNKVPLQIDHFLPLIVIFSSGFLAGIVIVSLIMGAVK